MFEANDLERPFTKEEIKEAIFYMTKDKYLGPNGFSLLFYQECWDILKGDLLEVFEEFWERGVMNKGVNAMFLVLIPKKEGAVEISNYRPISLVGSLYKIIAKVLSLRSRVVIGNVTFNS